jgi:hypothetical protein
MDFVVQPADLERVALVAGKLDSNPVRVAGRMAGLGSDELDAGVPSWAWVLVAFGAGVGAAVVLGPRLRRKVSFLKNW